MTLRERFNRIMRFQAVDRLPFVDFNNLFWVLRHRWQHQGMDPDANPFEFFGLDEAANGRATNWLNQGRGLETVTIDPYAMPRFEPRPTREEGKFTFTFDVRTGTLLKRMRGQAKGDLSVKAHAESPVKTREDWLAYKQRFDPHTPERYPRLKQDHLTLHPQVYPATWEECVRDIAEATHIVQIGLSSGLTPVSNAVGFETMLEALLLEREWMAETIAHFGWFSRESRRRAIETAAFDYVSFEDSTPPKTPHGEVLISPDLFLSYTEENYREGLAMVAAAGIELVELPHTRNRQLEARLVELVLDAGLTPILQADWDGEFDVGHRRSEYGNRFPVRGGMDARVLLAGEDAIDAMIDRVFTLAVDGGYFPALCNRYGELLEIPLASFEHYARAFRQANGMAA